MKALIKFTAIALAVLSLGIGVCVCIGEDKRACDPYWDETSSWYQSSDVTDVGKVDVFYIVSTEVASAKDRDGAPSWTATLTADDREYIRGEMAYVKKNIFHDDFNFYSPYYHQFTFESISLPQVSFDSVYAAVRDEVCNAFDYYMEHNNGGRCFVIAGFSQGAMLTIDLLKHMSDEQYSRLVAAYVIGYRLNEEDLRHPHVKAAAGESDTQVAISFNTVLNTDGIWGLVADGAATCINPVNWATDSTPALFTFDSQTVTISIAPTYNVLVADMPDKEPFRQWNSSNPLFSAAGVSSNCLHHWDLLFYTSQLHDNALKRATAFRCCDVTAADLCVAP